MHMQTCRVTCVHIHTCTRTHAHVHTHYLPWAAHSQGNPPGEATGQLCTVPRGPREVPRRPRDPAAGQDHHPPLLELQEDLGQRAAARHHGHVDGPQEAVVHPDQVLEGKPSHMREHQPEGPAGPCSLSDGEAGRGGASHISVGVIQPGGYGAGRPRWLSPPKSPETEFLSHLPATKTPLSPDPLSPGQGRSAARDPGQSPRGAGGHRDSPPG